MGFAFNDNYIPAGCGMLFKLEAIGNINNITSASIYNKNGIPNTLDVFIDK